jgi:hypothetical protein
MASDSIWVNKSEFKDYMEVSEVTALKYYSNYLEKAKKDSDQKLSIYDLAAIDKLPLDAVKSKLNRM